MTLSGKPAAMPLDHVGVSVADLSRSERFYRDLLGFDTVEDRFVLAQHGLCGVVLRNAAGARIELFEKQGAAPRAPVTHPADGAALRGWFQAAFRARDVEEAFSRLVAAGAAAVMPPFTAPDGQSRVAFIADPDGNLIELVERSGAIGQNAPTEER